MELVPGETLADAPRTRRLALSEVVRLGVQIAAALESAHDRGVVHRDLKPANIKITPDGNAKVLDFGLAKSEGDPLPLGSPHHTTVVTETGVLLGTACYMSPEQARGAEVDRRTDIWALGCVLFEMLAGRRLFARPSMSETLVEGLEREPDWSQLPPTTPESLRKLLRRCLEKDARRRLRDAGDARLELEEALTPATPQVGVDQPAVTPPRWRWVKVASLLVMGAFVGAALLYVMDRPPAVPMSEIRFAVPLPAGERLGATDFPALAIAPDGRAFVYVTARGGTTQGRFVVLIVSRLHPSPARRTRRARFFHRMANGLPSLPTANSRRSRAPVVHPLSSATRTVGSAARGILTTRLCLRTRRALRSLA